MRVTQSTEQMVTVAPYSSKVQQPMRATAVLSRHPRRHYAAPFDHEQGHASSLHPDGQPRSGETHRAESAHIAATRFTVVGNRHLQDDPAPVEPGAARQLTVVSDFGSETGAASRAHV